MQSKSFKLNIGHLKKYREKNVLKMKVCHRKILYKLITTRNRTKISISLEGQQKVG